MSLRNAVSCFPVLLATLLLPAFFATSSAAQQPAGARKSLTVERIYSQPGLGGRLTRGLPGLQMARGSAIFETKGSGKEPRPNSGRWTPPAESAASCFFRQARIDSPCGTLEAHASDGSWAPRAISISMGARWRGYSVSGPTVHLHGWM